MSDLPGSSIPDLLYHGTPNGTFVAFDTSPVYLTPSRDAAIGYARGQFARNIDPRRVPAIIVVKALVSNPKVFTAAELMEAIGIDGVFEWTNFDNLVCRLEQEGYDSAILLGIEDYLGGTGDEVKTGEYDQYVIFRAESAIVVSTEEINHA